MNEYIISDSFSETQINSRALIAIADGVGGNAGGELASRYILNQFDKINIEDITAEELHQFIENCNTGLLEYAKTVSGKRKHGNYAYRNNFITRYLLYFSYWKYKSVWLAGQLFKTVHKKIRQHISGCLTEEQIEEADICNKNEITYCFWVVEI